MRYDVPDESLSDPGWLLLDDDADGATNGAEIAAGTDPSSRDSIIKIARIVVNGSGDAEITFSTVPYKKYFLQSNDNLSNSANWVDVPGKSVMGGATAGAPVTITVPPAPDTYYRVRVSDVDTDNDHVSDWAEKVAGYNPNSAMTDGRTADLAAISSAAALINQVTVTVTKPIATQPSDAVTPPVETGSVTVSRGLAKLGSISAPDIVVPLQRSGSAIEGTDYDAVPSTVSLSGFATQAVIPIMPRFNGSRKANVVAIVKALSGAGYVVGSAASASVVINPGGAANGTGLTANYQNASSSDYPTQQGIFNGAAEMTREDAVIDFGSTANTIVANIALGNPSCVVTTTRATSLSTGDSVTIAGVSGGSFSPAINGTFVVTVIDATHFSVPVSCTAVPAAVNSATITPANNANGWASTATAGPRGMTSAATNNAFSVRWTGQILPKYSETYFIDFRGDDSAKVWVNGVLLIDRWTTGSAADYINTINLTASIPYDIQIDYWNSSGAAEAKLYWWSASQPKEIIPQSRLFPAPTQSQKVTPVTNSLTAVGYVSVPFTFSLSSPNIGANATSYALDINSGPLPPGLTLTSATGVISGTPTAVGVYNVAVNAINVAAGSVAGSSIVNFTIYPVGSVTRETLASNGAVTADGTIPRLDDDTNYGNNVNRRLRGYIVPPKTGNYYFWIDANNTAELWISNDAESVNRVRRATVKRLSPAAIKRTWNTSGTQQTQWLQLVAGQRYYFDVLHNTGTDADDYVSMGWCQDDIGTAPAVTGDANPNGVTPVIPNGGASLQGYPLSGTAPTYIFQPYDYPDLAPVTGTIYSTNLGPQGSSNTKASGSANLQLDDAQTQAVLHFYYQGLSSARTGYHLHSDAFGSHPAGEIVFDIDDVDQNHPELRTADGGYIWNLAAGGTFTSIQQVRDAISGGKVYLNVHSVNYPSGEIRGNLTRVEGSQIPPDSSTYPDPGMTDSPSNPAHAARFLNQATFGASPLDIDYLKTHSFSQWIDDQLTKAPSRTSNDVVAGVSSDINLPYPSSLFTNAWWKYSVTAEDQLRQRLAFALSEILVVSWANNTGPLRDNGRVLADYYDTLVDYCLPSSGRTDSGTFRGVLKNVTLTPAMGIYLDMRGNQKEDLSLGRHPNENYSREIMQLFSVGLNRTWDDGKFVLDSTAGLVATYTQPSILGVAGLLTGWNYAQPNQSNGRLPTNFGPASDFLNAMVLVPGQHDFVNPKLLLNNVVTPAATGQTPRVTLSSVSGGSPCKVNTATVHGLKIGDTVRISGVNGGTFSAPINAMLVVTNVVDSYSFNVGTTGSSATNINLTAGTPTYSSATVTGASVTPVAYTTTIAPITGSQFDSGGTTQPHPYDQYGLKELDTVIDNICNNDNVPPYICRQLIQRLVTSNPSAGYVYRVVQAWKDNGAGVRGDLGAVVRKILLDGEARNSTAVAANPAFGKQREPMLRLTGAARAFPAIPYTGTYAQLPANTVNANKLRITTSAVNDLSSGSNVALNFKANYTSTVPPTPFTNPTSTTYSIGASLGIAATHTTIASIGTGNPTVITTSQPHGLPGPLNTVWPTGLSGQFSSTINGAVSATSTGANSFTLPIDTTTVFQVASVAVGDPCVVTTTAPHNLAIGSTTNGVTINGVNGGAFVGAINSTNLSVVGIDDTTFQVTGVSCSSPPTSYTTWREVSNPCRVTTQVAHGLATGDSVTISSVSGGSFTPTINGTFPVTVVDSTSFTVASSCAAASTPNTGNIQGGNTIDVNATGMVNVTYSQAAGSNVMTVNTGGPQTNIAIPVPNSATTTLKSRVYLDVLTRNSTASIASIATGYPCIVTTTAPHGLAEGDVVTMASVTGGSFTPTINSTYAVTVIDGTRFAVLSNCASAPTAATGTVTGNYGGTPADGIYDVQTTTGTTSFTVLTADTPTAARTGNVIVPKISTSYTPISSNNRVQFNCNVNHNLQTGDHVWADVPVVGSPVADAEFVVIAPITGSGILPADEDHFQVSYLPVSSNLGTYPKPSGSQNGTTLFPLVPPPMGRSGVVTINESTFTLGSTEATLSQSPLNAPTVFNYFFPNYKFPGVLSNANLDSPEFQLSTDTNISNLTNSLTNMFIGTGGGNGNLNGLSSFNNGGGSVVMDIGAYLVPGKTADSGIPGLIDELADILVGAPLEAATKSIIQNFIIGKRPLTAIGLGYPCVITAASHGLANGSTVTISGVSGGTFRNSANTANLAINAAYAVTVIDANRFSVPVNCTNNAGLDLVNAVGSFTNFPMTTPTNQQMRDRVRAIIHLILTSAEYAVQK